MKRDRAKVVPLCLGLPGTTAHSHGPQLPLAGAVLLTTRRFKLTVCAGGECACGTRNLIPLIDVLIGGILVTGAQNERNPPVGYCNVGDSIRGHDAGGWAVVHRK
jgi:hypothetical protein